MRREVHKNIMTKLPTQRYCQRTQGCEFFFIVTEQELSFKKYSTVRAVVSFSFFESAPHPNT